MVDEVNNIMETAENKAASEALDRARLAREKREAEQRKRLEELRAHAAAAQAQRERRDEERRRRQAEQRSRDDDRRTQVEERKRAIWEASISRREALLQREKDRTERLERARAARSAPRPAFAFGSSTPRLLEPLDNAGFFWAARSTNPIDQMNFFESLAASTSNVMFASAPLTRRASALHLDSDTDNKDEPDRQPQPAMWSSVARRRTDLVPTAPASARAPEPRSGDTTPGSRPGSALSTATPVTGGTGVVRRPTTAPRRPRPASIAGTGVNTPRGTGDMGNTPATTPSVSRDGSVVTPTPQQGGDVPRRAHTTPRRHRPMSLHVATQPGLTPSPGEGKPPLHRKPKSAKDLDKSPRGKSMSASPGRTLSPSPITIKEHSVDKEITKKLKPAAQSGDKRQVSAAEVTQKLELLQVHEHTQPTKQHDKTNENKENIEINHKSNIDQKGIEQNVAQDINKHVEVVMPIEKEIGSKANDVNASGAINLVEINAVEQKPVEKTETELPKPTQKKEEKKEEKVEEKRDEKKESSLEKTEENEMTASMTARRITTEEEAKAALAERRRKAREELERQAELERQRKEREAKEEAERQRIEEERQRREEEEARELAALQRRTEEEKLRKAIEAQQQLEREEAERRVREEAERVARVQEDEEKRRAAEVAERQRREEAAREEAERVARKQRVEAIMARTRHKKAEEEKKNLENKQKQDNNEPQGDVVAPTAAAAPIAHDNGNHQHNADLLGLNSTQGKESKVMELVKSEESALVVPSAESNPPTNNGNVTADLLGLSEQNNTQDTTREQTSITPTNKQTESSNTPTLETNNGNVQPSRNSNIGHVSASFIQTERMSAEHSQKMELPKMLDDDFKTHNGHGNHNNHPLTLQNAI